MGLHANLANNLDEINDIIQEYYIPCQPEVLSTIQQELLSESPDSTKISLLVNSDVSTTASIIQIASLIHKDNTDKSSLLTVNEAIDKIGFKRLGKLIQSLMLRDRSKIHTSLHLDRFWDSASDVAIISMHIANKTFFPHPDEAYILGLFRDCGIPIMMQAFPNYKNLLREANSRTDKSLVTMENEYFGFNHQIVGYSLSQHWQLPWLISWGILTHHDIDPPSGQVGEYQIKNTLTAIIYVSEIISNHFRRQMHRRSSGEEWSAEWPTIHPHILKHMDINAHDLEDLMEDTLDNMNTILEKYER